MKPKNKKVCEGCKYLMKSDGLVSLNNTCNYMSITGKSRWKKRMVAINQKVVVAMKKVKG